MSSFAFSLTPENISEFVLDQGHGVKGLADLGIETLPEKYIQPPKHRFKAANNTGDLSIPIVDMSNLEDPTMQELVCNAAEKWGFFQIINHGVSLKELEDVKKAAYRFFELPVEEKAKYLKKNSASSNVYYGTSFSPEFEKVLEWKDYLSLFFVSDEESLSHWPLACRNEALSYMKITEDVIRHLIKILLKGLNIHEIDGKKESLMMGSKMMNLNFYPKCPNPELTFGVSNHSDVSSLTILLQDDVGGLYVRRLDDDDMSWIHVPPINGALVVNVGDALQILSNGKYRSVEHLVVANGSKNRVSIPIFLLPSSDHIIAPFQEITDKGDKPIYKGVLYSDYLKHFFGKPHDGKATIEFARVSC